KHAFERSAEPRAEERVNDDIVSPTRLRELFPRVDAFAFDEGQWGRRFRRAGFEACEPADCFKVSARVADSFGEFSEDDDRTVHAGSRQPTSECSAVTSVVTSATKDQGLFAGQVVV